MKRFFTLVIMCAALAFAGCDTYDDSGLVKKVDNLEQRVKSLEEAVERANGDIGTLRGLVDAFEQGVYVKTATPTAAGYVIELSDGRKLEIKHGSNGSNAPLIGVAKDSSTPSDETYYWTQTVGGETTFLKDGDNKIAASGRTPQIGVDAEGCWTIDGVRVGGGIKAEGEKGETGATGEKGDSFFQAVDTSDESFVIFTLANGTRITLPRGESQLYFQLPAHGITKAVNFGATADVTLTAVNIEYAEVLSVTEGWSAVLTFTSRSKKVAITAPAADAGSDEGRVIVVGLDKQGKTLMSLLKVVAVPDYTDPAGTFIVTEGNMGSQNGTVHYFDAAMNEYPAIYEKANDGRSPGNVLQDMWIDGNKAIFLSQNGGRLGGDGQIVVCDARTMQVEKIYNNLVFDRPAGKNSVGCPQHIAVVGNKAFIQYVDTAMESNSGIRVFDLTTGTLSADDIEGTYGTFAVSGALKGRMWVSRGFVVAALANAVVFIDPATATIVKRIDFPGRQVKGLVKAADGNFYAAVSGEFSGNLNAPSFTSDAVIVGFDHQAQEVYTQTLDGIKLPVATFQPTVNMCASFTAPHIYLLTQDKFSITDVDRFDYSTGTLDTKFISLGGYDALYGYMGVHPESGRLFVNQSISYMSTRVNIYDPSSPASPETLYNYVEASPAGVDFAYRFSTEFINK